MKITKQKTIIGNWKMNGRLASNQALLSEILAGIQQADAANSVEVGVCVPAVYLAQTQNSLQNNSVQNSLQNSPQGQTVKFGAQDCSAKPAGAYTGEIAAEMLAEFGCTYVLVGHSERRQYHGETSETVANKAKAALAAGLTPVVCVGETLEQRETQQTLDVMTAQMQPVLDLLGADAAQCVFAYEPVWAIGTGLTATPAQAQAVHAYLRVLLQIHIQAAAEQVAILYGGSMKPDNAAELLAQTDIDGGLIGGAALKATDFLAIIKAAANAV